MGIQKYLLGLDIGSSSIKAGLVNADSGVAVASAQSPSQELAINAPNPGWAEQDPDVWWEHVINAIDLLFQSNIDKHDVVAIGISYQMHGLVAVDEQLKVLRPSIIWCDSRATPFGNAAFRDIGEQSGKFHGSQIGLGFPE